MRRPITPIRSAMRQIRYCAFDPDVVPDTAHGPEPMKTEQQWCEQPGPGDDGEADPRESVADERPDAADLSVLRVTTMFTGIALTRQSAGPQERGTIRPQGYRGTRVACG